MRHPYKNRYLKKLPENLRYFLMIIGQLIVTGIIFNGCVTVGPDYVPVRPDAPEKWHAEMSSGLVADQTAMESPASW